MRQARGQGDERQWASAADFEPREQYPACTAELHMVRVLPTVCVKQGGQWCALGQQWREALGQQWQVAEKRGLQPRRLRLFFGGDFMSQAAPMGHGGPQAASTSAFSAWPGCTEPTLLGSATVRKFPKGCPIHVPRLTQTRRSGLAVPRTIVRPHVSQRQQLSTSQGRDASQSLWITTRASPGHSSTSP